MTSSLPLPLVLFTPTSTPTSCPPCFIVINNSLGTICAAHISPNSGQGGRRSRKNEGAGGWRGELWAVWLLEILCTHTAKPVRIPAWRSGGWSLQVPVPNWAPLAAAGCCISHRNHLSCVLSFWKHGPWWNSVTLRFRERKRPKPGTQPCSQEFSPSQEEEKPGSETHHQHCMTCLWRIVSALWASVG